MAVTINASTSAGLVQTADTTGNLSLQSNGTTIAALTSTGLAVTGAGSFSTTLGVTGTSTLAAVNASGLFTNTYNSISDFKLIVQNTGSNDGVSGGLILGAKNTAGTQSNVSFGVESVNGANASATIRTAGSGTGFGNIRFTIDGAGAVTIPGTLGVTGAGFTFSGAGLGNFGTTTSGAGIGTTLQSFTFDSSTASGASPHDICATFKNDTAAGQTLILWNAVNSGDPSWIKFYTEPTGSASLRGSINYNRSAGLTAYNTTSDYRSKDIAGPLENTGEAIDKLKVYLGTMKGATIARPMMIAHEAQEIAPYAVTGTKDQVDKNGEPEFQQMDHQSFVPLLLAEIQSLRARLAALENK